VIFKLGQRVTLFCIILTSNRSANNLKTTKKSGRYLSQGFKGHAQKYESNFEVLAHHYHLSKGYFILFYLSLTKQKKNKFF